LVINLHEQETVGAEKFLEITLFDLSYDTRRALFDHLVDFRWRHLLGRQSFFQSCSIFPFSTFQRGGPNFIEELRPALRPTPLTGILDTCSQVLMYHLAPTHDRYHFGLSG
jgi:hypothetical protein